MESKIGCMAVLAATLGGTGSATDLPNITAEPQDLSEQLGALVLPSLTPDLLTSNELPGDLRDQAPDRNHELAGLLLTPRFLLVTGFNKTVAV